MSSPRIQALVSKLEKGKQKTRETLSRLTPEQWQQIVYAELPAWTARDLLAHFVSAEDKLLALAQDVALGGRGTPEGFDLDSFNSAEQKRLLSRSPAELLDELDAARQRTLDWVRTLDDECLDRVGNHPGLGEVSLEVMIVSIYGHQLFHIRDWQSQ